MAELAPNQPQFLSIPAAGRRLGVGRTRAYELASAGEMPVVQIAGRLCVPLLALEALEVALADRAVDKLGGLR